MAVTPADVEEALPSTRSSVLFALPPEATLRRRRGGLVGRLARFLTLMCVLGLVLGGLTAGGYYLLNRIDLFPRTSGTPDATRPDGSLVYESDSLNYRLAAPPAPWLPDNVTRPAGKITTVALQRSNPRAWMALVAQDHSKDRRPPRDAEIVDGMVRRLQTFFKDTLDYEQLADGQLAGQRAQRLSFRALDAKNTSVRGECYLLEYRDVVYWFLTWAPAEDAAQLQQEFAELRKRFTLLDRRADWPDRTPKLITLEGSKAAYTLQDLDDIWRQQTKGTDYDPAADMALTANDLLEVKDVVPFAQVLVLLLKPQGKRTPSETARAYYESRQKGKVEVEVLADREGRVGDVPGQILRLRVRKANGERFVLLAVVNQGNDILAIQGECDWKRRSLWERDFSRLVSTFRWKK